MTNAILNAPLKIFATRNVIDSCKNELQEILSAIYRLEVMMINKENYLRNIPAELREYKQWLWFKKIRKQDLKGKGKILKIPVSPITFKSDDWNNKEQWVDFETAVNNLESIGSERL